MNKTFYAVKEIAPKSISNLCVKNNSLIKKCIPNKKKIKTGDRSYSKVVFKKLTEVNIEVDSSF